MKRITAIVLLACLAANGIAQQTRPDSLDARVNSYRSRSTGYLVTGCIALATGTLAAFAGANAQRHADFLDFSGGVVEVLGIMVASASIPLFAGAIYCHGKISRIQAGIGFIPGNAVPGMKYTGQGYAGVRLALKL